MASAKEPKIKKYQGEDVTVIWAPDKCIHSENCYKGLPQVFDPNRRPWIEAQAADRKQLMDQIDNCPSGALTYEKSRDATPNEGIDSIQVEIVPDGPFRIVGNLSIKHSDGTFEEREGISAFCRCGASSKKPYCDGTHKKMGFQDD